MVKQRITETNEGIQDASCVEDYDVMLKHLRDKGFLETKAVLKSGIERGSVLEVGPGPGYLGLEWLKNTDASRLTGLEISENMIQKAQENAQLYGLTDRVNYILGNAVEIPFENNTFDGVFSNGSLHEWEHPEKVFMEIERVLKPGGRYFVSDLKRDMNWILKGIFYFSTKPKTIRPGFISSINAAYTREELEKILTCLSASVPRVISNPFGIEITGVKKIA